jgi:DNA-directed RNA polymerase sigma subunit (sigma70/sigma32)
MFEQPATDAYVAMMAAAPYEEIEIEPEPYGATFELAEEILTEEEFAVIQMLFGGRLSQRETGLLLARQKGRATAYSKTWVRKLRNRALQKMRKYGTVGDTPQKNLGDR